MAGETVREGCDTVLSVAWNRRLRLGILLVAASTFTATGCLLYTDPINTAPMVDIVSPQTFPRATPLTFQADARDDQPGTLSYSWGLVRDACPDGGQVPSRAGEISSGFGPIFTVTLGDAGAYCVFVDVVDGHGAEAHDTTTFRVDDRPPTAVITRRPPGLTPSGPIALYSALRFSRDGSSDPDPDTLAFTWTLVRPGGNPEHPQPCATPADDVCFHPCDTTTDDVCFRAVVPGSYTLTLDVQDGAGMSAQEVLPLTVADDQAPCIVQTAPTFSTQGIVSDPAVALAFQVDGVDDDGDPFPSPTTWQSEAWFAWSYRVGTSGPFTRIAQWDLASFSFPAGNFQPGQILQVRVEANDRRPEQTELRACELSAIDATTCEPRVGCDQWVTWTVELR